ALVVWFANLDARRLIKSDEGRYAEIAREMAVGGDWITPRLNDIKYFYKPPLQYWATAAFYKAFGIDEWTARLWNALTGLATVLFTAYFAARLFGRERGIAAGIVLGSSALLVGLAHVLTLDMGLTCFMTVTLGGFLLAQRDGASARETRRWMMVAWAGMGLGVLSKGLPALVLPGAVLVLYSLWQRDFALWKRLHFGKGLLLLFAIAAPWFVAVSLANPEFPRYFFWHEHVERFLTRVHGRYEPWWYFIPVLAGGLLPWTLLAPRALALGARRRIGSSFQPARVLWLWAVVIFVFFSASSSKLASYILPVFPALAVLLSLALARVSARALRWALAPVAVGALALAAATPWSARLASREIPAELYAAYAPWVAASMLLLAAGLVGALWLDARGRRGAALVTAGLAGLVSTQGVVTGHGALAPAQSAAAIAGAIRPSLRPDVPLYSVNFYDQTLNFYIGRTVTLVEHKNEFEFGIAQEPHKFVPTFDEFARRWAADPQALAITSREYFPRIQSSGLPLVVIAEDTRRVVFRKP
ncbi:MAG: glycosyltransferase family 39 protein, partial [Burkholderiaceae bacterium]|nr:glycosyltransferase family 39 protein [Burkholderiaceae bacterium]